VNWLVRRWRQSLELRIVATTLVVSAIVVALLGLVVLDQVKRGLIDAKTRVALAETTAGVRSAEAQFQATDRATAGETTSVLLGLAPTGGATLFRSIVLPDPNSQTPQSTGFGGSCSNECEASIPTSLKSYVTDSGKEGYVYTRIRNEDGTSEPGLAVGAVVNAGNAGNAGVYQVYNVFSLQQEQDTLSLVRSTLTFAGLALVLLLAGIALLVTRQVVAPVRVAARTASSLTAGRLEERMAVHGEDDLAKLATSFNLMADSLQRQIVQLEELSRVQRQFVSDVSHELRTPLTTVRMAADLLHENRGVFEPSVARSAELLQTQLDRFEALLGDLLEISRHDAGAVALDAEPVDLRAIVERVVVNCEPLAQRRGSAVRINGPRKAVTAEVDSRRIERILRNLLVNAFEHGEGNDIEVTVGADADSVAVAVRDHGVGLQPGEAAKVFNRFWRADPARARTTGGTGLGLSIALEDARLHGGWLQAWGAPGRGAVFWLTLPRHAGQTLYGSPLALQPEDDDVAPPQTDQRAHRGQDDATAVSVPDGGPHA
jgi:two-component system, OmpR family, sensor histidine kinase MtrB